MKWRIEEYIDWLNKGAPTNDYVTILNISFHDVKSLNKINRLTGLQELYCYRNKIKTIEFLNLPELRILDCSETNIINIEKLNAPLLEKLDCSRNSIKNIEGLKTPLLKELKCSYTFIENIENLNTPLLEKLYCSSNRITNIENLNTPLLEKLYCSSNRITNIENLNTPLLKSLHCYKNRITNIENIYLPVLEKINCVWNFIENIENLILPMLQIIDCSNNKIRNISLRHIGNLTSFKYNNNPVNYIAPNIRNILDRTKQNIYSDRQNVHNHHIQECIRNSIHNVISTKPTISKIHNYIINDTILSESCKRLLFEYIGDKTIHSTLHITFSNLLLCTLSLIESNEFKDDIKMILNEEITDSQCKCYTGRMSRLVNCLNGYTDKVNIRISDTEQIGYVIESIKKELILYDEYDVEKHKEMVKIELLDRQYSINVIDEWISYIE